MQWTVKNTVKRVRLLCKHESQYAVKMSNEKPELVQGSAEERVAEAIRRERERRGWSQSHLADLASASGVKFDGTAVTRIEKGDRRLRLDEAVALSRALGVDLGVLSEHGDDSATFMEFARDLAEAWERLVDASAGAFRAYARFEAYFERAVAGGVAIENVMLESGRGWLDNYWPDRALEAGRRMALGEALAAGETPSDSDVRARPGRYAGYPLEHPESLVDRFHSERRGGESSGVDPEA